MGGRKACLFTALIRLTISPPHYVPVGVSLTVSQQAGREGWIKAKLFLIRLIVLGVCLLMIGWWECVPKTSRSGLPIQRLERLPTLDPVLYAESKILRDRYLRVVSEVPLAVEKTSTHFLCRTPERQVVAFCLYDPGTSRVRHLIVAPTWRHYGLGRALLEAVKVEGKFCSCKQAEA